MGWREISPEEWKALRRESPLKGLTYLVDGPFPMSVKDGIVHEFLFRASIGEVPSKELAGVELRSDMSYREVITALQNAGYEIRIIREPYVDFKKNADYEGHLLFAPALITAQRPKFPEIAFQFFFYGWKFWSPMDGDRLAYINGTPGSTFAAFPVKIPKIPPMPKPGNERQRALDLAVVLSVQNSGGYTELMPDIPGEKYTTADGWREFLEEFWGIRSREDYFRVFNETSSSGHTESYREALALLDENYGVPIQTIAIANGLDAYHCNRLFFAAQTREWLGERSLRAWDLARLINVTRWAYAAGYVGETEAWNMILPIAATVRGLYHSREDFIVSYIGGRGFFKADQANAAMEAAYTDFMKESKKIDSRQHLPWYFGNESPEPALSALRGRDAVIGDLLYTVTEEQKEANATYALLNSSIAKANEGIRAGDLRGALEAMNAAESILQDNRIGKFKPDLYYAVKIARGKMLMGEGHYSLALEAFYEAASRMPNDSELLRLIGSCREKKLDQQ